MIPVQIYGAHQCHLCQEAEALLRRLAPELDLEIEVLDITVDPGLEFRFRAEIPVVFLAGRKAFKYRVDEVELRRRVERLKRAPA